MTPEEAIKAGTLAAQRKFVRALFRDGGLLGAKLSFSRPGKADTTIAIDPKMTTAVLEGLDLALSTELLKLGVPEHEDPAPLLAAPRPDPRRPSRAGRLRPRPRPPAEPAG